MSNGQLTRIKNSRNTPPSQWNNKFGKNNFSKVEQQFLIRTQQIISENINNKEFSVAELAQHMCMGRGNLYRLMKSLTGLSPNIAIVRVRLSKAKFLLENSNLRINEVADEIGYTDNAYFSRAFRKYYGYPPSQARA